VFQWCDSNDYEVTSVEQAQRQDIAVDFQTAVKQAALFKAVTVPKVNMNVQFEIKNNK